MKTRVITSAVGLVVLFAVMALFDTFVFNVVIAAICLLAIHEVFKAFRFEKAAYIYWGFVPYTLLVMFSDFHMVRICMLPASYIFALYLVLCVIGNSKSINYAKLGGMVLFSCIIMFCFYSLIYLKQPPVRYFTSEMITPVWQCGCGFSCTVFYRTISSACTAKYLLTPTDTLIRLYTGSSLQRYEKLLLL